MECLQVVILLCNLIIYIISNSNSIFQVFLTAGSIIYIARLWARIGVRYRDKNTERCKAKFNTVWHF